MLERKALSNVTDLSTYCSVEIVIGIVNALLIKREPISSSFLTPDLNLQNKRSLKEINHCHCDLLKPTLSNTETATIASPAGRGPAEPESSSMWKAGLERPERAGGLIGGRRG